MKPDRTLIYSESCLFWNCGIFRTLSNVYDEAFYSELLSIAYLDSWCIQNFSIFRTQNIQYWESLKYSLHRTMFNLGIFTTLVYLSHSPGKTQKPAKHVWSAVSYRTLCNTGIFRTQGIFTIQSNICYGKNFVNNIAYS